eukprot:1157540-Pelagomonas_calceolata.AAC.5
MQACQVTPDQPLEASPKACHLQEQRTHLKVPVCRTQHIQVTGDDTQGPDDGHTQQRLPEKRLGSSPSQTGHVLHEISCKHTFASGTSHLSDQQQLSSETGDDTSF